jgi:hypothetical protein
VGEVRVLANDDAVRIREGRAFWDLDDVVATGWVRATRPGLDVGWRAIALGHSIGFVPGAVLHYRSRSDLQGMLRQRYRYAQGTAQLAKRHVALGSLPRPSAREQRRRLVRYFRSTLALHKLDTREGRWAYGLRCAWAAGAISGWVRHGILV